jgi:hypothetical protein
MGSEIDRRGFLGLVGAFAAPAVILTPGLLMPVHKRLLTSREAELISLYKLPDQILFSAASPSVQRQMIAAAEFWTRAFPRRSLGELVESKHDFGVDAGLVYLGPGKRGIRPDGGPAALYDYSRPRCVLDCIPLYPWMDKETRYDRT